MKNIDLKLGNLKSLLLFHKLHAFFKKKFENKKRIYFTNDKRIPGIFDSMSILFLNRLFNHKSFILPPNYLIFNWFSSKKKKFYPKFIFLCINEKFYIKIPVFSNYSNCKFSIAEIFSSNKKKKTFKPEEKIFIHFCSQIPSKMKNRGLSNI